jgi:hypothetical protein
MGIHLLDSSAVEKELSEDRVTEADRATYLTLAWIISVLIGYSTLTYSNVSRTWLGLFEGLSLVIIIVWGFWYAFVSNGGKRGRDFVARFACLLVPASIKANIVVWGAYYVLGWGFRWSVQRLSFPSEESADLFASIAHRLPVAMTYLANVASQVGVFWIIARHLRRISQYASEVSKTHGRI